MLEPVLTGLDRDISLGMSIGIFYPSFNPYYDDVTVLHLGES